MARYKRIKKKTDLTAPDEFVGFWERAYIWVEENRDKMLLPILGVIIVFMLLGGFFYYGSSREASAQRDLYFALKDYLVDGESANPDEIIANLSEISSRFSGSLASKVGDLYKANLLYVSGKIDEAAAGYKALVDSGNEEDTLTCLAALGYARTLQDQGKYSESNEALGRYLKSPNPILGEDMSILSAENHELNGDFQAALKEYSAFLEKYPLSPRTTEVQQKADSLSRKS